MSAIYPPALTRVTLTATLTAWLRAWRAGYVHRDEVVARIGSAVEDFRDHEHMVLDGTGSATSHAAPLGDVLPTFASAEPEDIRLVLPSAGDTRGLPVVRATSPAHVKQFAIAAMEAGAAITCTSSDNAMGSANAAVPDSTAELNGTAEPTGTAPNGAVGLVVEPILGRMVAWRRYSILAGESAMPGALSSPAPSPAREELTVTEADGVLLGALRDVTALLDSLELARHHPEQAARLAGFHSIRSIGPELPAGYPQRNRLLVARAAMVLGITELAAEDGEGGAVNSHEIAARLTALRDVTAAARLAFVAAINGPLTPDSARTSAQPSPAAIPLRTDSEPSEAGREE